MPSSICLTVTLGLLLGIGPIGGAAWTQEALDLYDLIEEVKTLLGARLPSHTDTFVFS